MKFKKEYRIGEVYIAGGWQSYLRVGITNSRIYLIFSMRFNADILNRFADLISRLDVSGFRHYTYSLTIKPSYKTIYIVQFLAEIRDLDGVKNLVDSLKSEVRVNLYDDWEEKVSMAFLERV